jgi:hypothetical protein
MNRSHNFLISLAVLAMLTFALTSLQAQSSVTNSAPPTAATNTNAPTRPISDAQFKKILADNAANGQVTPIQPIVVKTFGVEPGQERHDTFISPDKNYNTVAQFNNGNYLFSVANESFAYDYYVYYVDKNLVLIDAAYVTKDGATIIPNKDAQAGLNAELKFFAGIADQL